MTESYLKFVLLSLVLVSANLCRAQLRATDHFFVPQKLVEEVVTRDLLHEEPTVAGVRTEMMTEVVTSSLEPRLHVVQVSPLPMERGRFDNMRRVAVRLACAGLQECLPFYAIVTLPENMVGTLVAPSSTSMQEREPLRAARSTPQLRRGERVTLVLRDSQIQIKLPALTLQDGRLGEYIRVIGRDSKRSYRAKIISSTMLEGQF